MEKELEKRLEDDTRFKQAVSEAAKRYNIGVLIVGTMSAGAAADEFGSLLIHGHDDLDKLKELHAFVTESVEGALRGEGEEDSEEEDTDD